MAQAWHKIGETCADHGGLRLRGGGGEFEEVF